MVVVAAAGVVAATRDQVQHLGFCFFYGKGVCFAKTSAMVEITQVHTFVVTGCALGHAKPVLLSITLVYIYGLNVFACEEPIYNELCIG